MTPLEQLVGARELIAEHGWVRGNYGDRNVGFCALGALHVASKSWTSWGAQNLLVKAGGAGALGVISHNDIHIQSKQEALEWFDKAIRLAQAEVAA
jgi:hypothetical protein